MSGREKNILKYKKSSHNLAYMDYALIFSIILLVFTIVMQIGRFYEKNVIKFIIMLDFWQLYDTIISRYFGLQWNRS